MSDPAPETQDHEGEIGQPVDARNSPWLAGLHAFQDTFNDQATDHEDLALWEPGISSQAAQIGLSAKGSDHAAVVVRYNSALDAVELSDQDMNSMTAYGASQRLGKPLDETIALVQATGAALKDGVTAHREATAHIGQTERAAEVPEADHDVPGASHGAVPRHRQSVLTPSSTSTQQPVASHAPSAAEVTQSITHPTTHILN
ncbi:hypothetical protein FCK90_14465 [Kocuria coralli]|uniref:Uncharacterized protein n=1 Tax=Kocuria coralli TaxID=1461025 RepID=A0A5J5KTS7_9MICC|nr:hypothetical protein [Kocuria coralli]KAA9393004.1 hypothetical protein FCK90_14465 [Kocuria coralli]